MKSLLGAIFMVVCAQVSAIWPRGQYCLPMPSNQRCPLGWDDGYSFQTTEGNNSVQGAVPYVATRGQDLGWGFCCKTRVRYSSRRFWPKGRYCIFRKGGFCPRGFMEGITLFYLGIFLAGGNIHMSKIKPRTLGILLDKVLNLKSQLAQLKRAS